MKLTLHLAVLLIVAEFDYMVQE